MRKLILSAVLCAALPVVSVAQQGNLQGRSYSMSWSGATKVDFNNGWGYHADLTGQGVSLRIGSGFLTHPNSTIGVGAHRDWLGERTLTQVVVDGRYYLGESDDRMRPYGGGLLGGTYISSHDQAAGMTYGVLGGVEYFQTSRISVDVGASYAAGKYTKVKLSGAGSKWETPRDDMPTSTFRFSAGLAYRP